MKNKNDKTKNQTRRRPKWGATEDKVAGAASGAFCVLCYVRFVCWGATKPKLSWTNSESEISLCDEALEACPVAAIIRSQND